MDFPEGSNTKAPRGRFSLWSLPAFCSFRKASNKIGLLPKFFVSKSKKEEQVMMHKKSWLLVILAVFGLTACAGMQAGQGGGDTPYLPDDIKIIPPSPDLPKDIATFSGKWEGRWLSGMAAILVVEEIHDTWAQVLYSRTSSDRNDMVLFTRSGHFRLIGKVVSNPKPNIVLEKDQFKGFAYDDLYFEVKDSNTLVARTARTQILMKRANQ